MSKKAAKEATLVGCASRLVRGAALILHNCSHKTKESYLSLKERDISVEGIRLNLEEFSCALNTQYTRMIQELEQ